MEVALKGGSLLLRWEPKRGDEKPTNELLSRGERQFFYIL